MTHPLLPTASTSGSNLRDYAEACAHFNWEEVEKQFTWHQTGKVNVVHEMIDRHPPNKTALLYWNKEKNREESYTFGDLKRLSSQLAHALKKRGVQKGDRVAIFLPRSPDLYLSFLAVLRIGAIPVPLFEAFMEEAATDRLLDSGACLLITLPPFLPRVEKVPIPTLLDVDAELRGQPEECEPAWLTLDDGLVMHYTSGSTGKAKGVLHRQYAMVGHYQTTLWSLDLKPSDIYWCTADPGWVTGTSYGIFGPWLLGNTSLVLGGRFSAETWYEAIQKFKVTVWYSAPTAFRMLMALGKGLPGKFDLSSLRHICSVGEPLNPEALLFIRDITHVAPLETWWMTETGMHLVCNFKCLDLKIGATGKPFPGTYATVVDNEGRELAPHEIGHLAVRPPWPSLMKAIWGHPEKYQEYFRHGWYYSGDSAYKDEEGFIWFCGREDDVIKTQGERVGPFEVESALLEHPAVAEAGVIGKPDPLRGNIVKAYIALRPGFSATPELKHAIAQHVKEKVSSFAMPREIEFIAKLPKTRSGKIMRRILRALDQGKPLGDISTLED